MEALTICWISQMQEKWSLIRELAKAIVL